MHCSRLTPILLVCTLVLSIFVVKISNIITVSDEWAEDVSGSKRFYSNVTLGAEPNHLMWFVQVSDLHLSMFHDAGRVSDLRDFCNNTLSAIRPSVVLASGDLADGKAPDHMGSDQYIKEWEFYKDIIESTKVEEKTIWLDIRGNHDNFNVAGIQSEKSYYHRYSVQGKKHLRSYIHTISKGREKYSFVAVDACLEPGPKRPFNFIGSINDEQFELLEEFEKESRTSNGVVWFGHYPTSCILSPHPGIRHVMRNSIYLCGHLHTLGGLVTSMYTRHHSGLLELELGDWKDNRLYRVAAFDHGVFTFTDIPHNTWPVVLVTNPMDSLYSSQRKEENKLIKHSTHIRLLVFSPQSIEKVRVRFDRDVNWVECHNVEGPLHVAKWDPSLFSYGIHQIHVYARDTAGHSIEISQPFSLDGSKGSFGFIPRIILMTDAREVFQLAFGGLVFLSVFPLVVLRLVHILVKNKRLNKPSFRYKFLNKLLRKLWILSTQNKLLVPLVIYPLYVVVGPWFVGEVIEGHIGISFAWGTIVNGKLLPGSFTYLYGVIQLFFFHMPFVLALSHCVDCRFQSLHPDLVSSPANGNPNPTTTSIYSQFPCAVILFFHAVFAYAFWQAYGWVAFFLGPLRTWSFFMGLYLWYGGSRLQRSHFVEIHVIWPKPASSSQNGSSHRL